MTKITVDKALIEQAIEAAFSPYCAQALGILVPALRAALAKPAGRVVCTNKQAVEVRNSIGLMKNEDERNNYGNHATAIQVLEAYLALDKQAVEPVAWEWRWFDANPNTVTFGQWSEWKRVEPRNRLCTVEDSLNEFRAYIANGNRYELRALFASPPPPAEVPLLTDKEVAQCIKDASKGSAINRSGSTSQRIARGIEQAVRQNVGLV